MTFDWKAEAWQGEGLSVEVLYSRAGVGTQILVSSNDGDVLLDVGDGTLRDLLSKGESYELSKLKGAVITHGHCDHVGGLWSLLGVMRILARKEDFTIALPEGSKEPEDLISKFLENYRDTMTFKVNLIRVTDGSTFKIGGFAFTAYSMLHKGSTLAGLGELLPALGYSIEYKGQRIVFTGDTDYCENLEELVKGADIALIEATWGSEKNLGHEGVHLTVPEAMKAGKLAKEFRVIHFTKRSRKYFEENYG